MFTAINLMDCVPTPFHLGLTAQRLCEQKLSKKDDMAITTYSCCATNVGKTAIHIVMLDHRTHLIRKHILLQCDCLRKVCNIF